MNLVVNRHLILASSDEFPGWAALQAISPLPVLQLRIPARIIEALADANAALMIVNGDEADWRAYAVTPKTSPATRRIPIVVASDDAAVREDALRSGANLALTWAELTEQFTTLLAETARIPDPETLDALQNDCDEPLPADAIEAVNRFNSGEYYKQHDLFEALWISEERPIRDLYRAVLQVGIGYFQATKGNQRGALKMLLRSIQWLSLLPDVCQGIDVAALRADAAIVRVELERVGPDGMADFNFSLLKPVRRIEKNAL